MMDLRIWVSPSLYGLFYGLFILWLILLQIFAHTDDNELGFFGNGLATFGKPTDTNILAVSDGIRDGDAIGKQLVTSRSNHQITNHQEWCWQFVGLSIPEHLYKQIRQDDKW